MTPRRRGTEHLADLPIDPLHDHEEETSTHGTPTPAMCVPDTDAPPHVSQRGDVPLLHDAREDGGDGHLVVPAGGDDLG